jgi:L-alanine-DL-glutamate epimerase-like enolase superfamily enzyme
MAPVSARGSRPWPLLLGLDPRRVLDVERAMDMALPGHLYAKSPIDMACWDIAGQAAGLPIADLMGGGSRTPRPIASSVGAKTVEETREVMDRYRARGYIAHSVKIGGDVARDIARIRDVEEIRRPARSCFTTSTAAGPARRRCRSCARPSRFA